MGNDLNVKQVLPKQNIAHKDLSDLVVDSIQDIKGKNIIKMDLRKLDFAPTDYFIICEGDSSTQISAIAQNVYRRLKEEAGVFPNHMEGMSNSNWILVDYFDIVVHVFYPETREFYNLENLWNDSEIIKYEDV